MLIKNQLRIVTLLLLMMVGAASAEPERIKPGIAYYADDYTVVDHISRLGEERNYEEVYKNYEYYEAYYNEKRQLSIFNAYKKGEIVRTERYSYHPSGKVAKKEIVRPGKETEVITFDP